MSLVETIAEILLDAAEEGGNKPIKPLEIIEMARQRQCVSISTNHPDKTVGRDSSFGMETVSFAATDVQRSHHNVSVMVKGAQ